MYVGGALLTSPTIPLTTANPATLPNAPLQQVM